jgi:hypothetical protein
VTSFQRRGAFWGRTYQGLAGAEVEQHVMDDSHVRLGLKAHDVGSLFGQGGATGHVHVVALEQTPGHVGEGVASNACTCETRV